MPTITTAKIQVLKKLPFTQILITRRAVHSVRSSDPCRIDLKTPFLNILQKICAKFLATAFIITGTYGTSAGQDLLTISKSVTTSPAKPGDPIVYQITYTNLNSLNTASNITVKDFLPAVTLFTYVSSTAGGVYDATARAITWSGLSLPAGASATLTISGICGMARGPAGSYDPLSYYISSGSSTQNISNNASIQNPTLGSPIYINAPVNVSVSQFCGGSLPATLTGYIKSATNSEIYYQLTLTNNGNVTDKFTLTTTTPGTGETIPSYIETVSGAVLTQTPYIQPGNSYSFIVRFKASPGTTPGTVNYTNMNAISFVCGTISTTNITTYVYGGQPPAGSTCDLQISKTASVNPATVGSNFVYTITVVNNSASRAANNLLIIDNLPAGVNIVSYNATSGVTISSPSSSQIRALKSSQTNSDNPIVITITVTPTCTAVPSVVNQVVVSTSTPDSSSGNDQVSITTNVNSLLASPTGNGTTICSGNSGLLTATSSVTNPGFKWYSASSGGTSLFTGSSFTTPALTTNATYYVAVYASASPGCESARTPVTATVIAAPVLTSPISTTTCESGNAMFGISATGASLTYQWQVNSGSGYVNLGNGGIYSGVLTNNLTISAATTAQNGYLYRCLVKSGTCAAISSTGATLSVKTNGTWLGVNNNWNDVQNWCGNLVPTINTDVLIPVVASSIYPLLSSTGYCRNLTLAATTSLGINNATLQISGGISTAGSISASTAAILLNGSSLQSIPAGAFVNNALYDLIINNPTVSGVAINGTLDIYGSVTFMGSGKKLYTNDLLTLKSTVTNTARIGDMTGNTIVGKVTVERYISARKAWRLLAIPTSTTQTIKEAWQEGASNSSSNPIAGFGTQITSNRSSWSADGFDSYSVGGPSLKVYNSGNDNFDGVTTLNAAFPNPKGGFMTFIRGERNAITVSATPTATILRTTGNLYTGDQPPVSVPASKFAAIGNPYASVLDARNITKSGIKDFFYLWDPNLSGYYGYGGYQTLSYDGSDYVITPGGVVTAPAAV